MTDTRVPQPPAYPDVALEVLAYGSVWDDAGTGERAVIAVYDDNRGARRVLWKGEEREMLE